MPEYISYIYIQVYIIPLKYYKICIQVVYKSHF